MTICILILMAALGAAILSDLRDCTVCDLCWWAGLAACGGLLGVRIAAHGLLSVDWVGTGLFLLVQQLIMSRAYGRADCHAYSICALGLAGLGLELRDFTAMMLVSFLLLVGIQFLRNNITTTGKLRTPVAFVPYIGAGFAVAALLGT